MLEPLPTRSVTRFLLPLADVMTLLFAIFLLLPHLEEGSPRPSEGFWTPEEQRRAREELSRLRRLHELPTAQRVTIIVLDIDGKTGDLLLHEGSEEVRLTDETIDAVLEKHIAAAHAADKELFYLLRVPRPQPVHPDLQDEERYRRWFGKRKVDYRIDYPRLAGS